MSTLPSPRNIRAFLFDLGGVVFQISFDRAFESWQSLSDLSVQQMRSRFGFDEPYRRHERGEITRDEYFDHLRSLLNLRGDDAQIEAGWNAIFMDEITETMRLVQRTRGVMPCFAFSNSNFTHHGHWSAKYPSLAGTFDRIFVSCDIGLRKPDREAFEFVATTIGVAPESILFFDDTLENVRGAAAAGMAAVHVLAPDQVAEAIRAVTGAS